MMQHGNYEWVEPHEIHECKEFKKMRLLGIQIIIWASGGATLQIGMLGDTATSTPVNFCPYCGIKFAK